MRCLRILTLSFVSWLALCSTETLGLSRKDIATLADMLHGRNGNGKKLDRREIRTPWTTILNGLLRSQTFASVAAQVPCDIVNELENNAEAAEQFVREIQAGQVPTIIENLSEEIVNAFGSIVNVALSLPEALWDTAENVVDGFEDLFDSIADGSIVSDLPQEIADAWEDVTAGFVNAWDAVTADIACLFGNCAEPTPGGCASSIPASAYASVTPMVYYNTSSVAYSYSYNWALSSAVAAASSAAYIQASASESSLQPMAIGTSIVFVQPTYSAAPSASDGATIDNAATPMAVGSRSLLWMLGMIVGNMVVLLWL